MGVFAAIYVPATATRKVSLGTVAAINGNSRAMLRRGRGYRDREYLLVKVSEPPPPRHHHAA